MIIVGGKSRFSRHSRLIPFRQVRADNAESEQELPVASITSWFHFFYRFDAASASVGAVKTRGQIDAMLFGAEVSIFASGVQRMSHKDHSHHNQHKTTVPKKGFHRDWRFWVAVILMLGAMGMYVATMDEALGPGQQAGEEVPAMAE
jgi:hypothetical protein